MLTKTVLDAALPFTVVPLSIFLASFNRSKARVASHFVHCSVSGDASHFVHCSVIGDASHFVHCSVIGDASHFAHCSVSGDDHLMCQTRDNGASWIPTTFRFPTSTGLRIPLVWSRRHSSDCDVITFVTNNLYGQDACPW